MRPVLAAVLFVGGLAAFGSGIHFYGEVEPSELWRIIEEHPALYETDPPVISPREIMADGKVTRHELAQVLRLVESHDHSLCVARLSSRRVE